MAIKNVAEEGYNISSKAIRKKVKNSEATALKRYKIDSYILLDFDKVLNDVYCSIRPVSADYETRKTMVKCLNALALEIYGNSKESSPVLEAYGSFVMDMFSSQSDLDVSINLGIGFSEIPRDMKIQILKRFAKKLRSCEGKGIVKNVESIFSAKVPIVKFFDQGTDVECDLSVENKGGILNSQIIRLISHIDERFQKLCMLVKRWAKANEVNSALHRTLNSVSITLLVAHHLQTQTPPILPPFSLLFIDGMEPTNVENRIPKFINWGSRNKESVGRLFATFFIKLQSVEFLWRQGLSVSVLNGLWISHKWKKAGAAISVEDFTDVSQNVARRVNDKGAQKIYSSINRTVEDIFGFLNGNVTETNLRQRLFGQQAVMEPPPLVLPLNDNISVTDVRHRLLRQQAVMEPPPPVLPLHGTVAGTHLNHGLFGQRAVMEPPPPMLRLNGNIAGTDLTHGLFGQRAVMEPPPPMLRLNGNIAGTDLTHGLFGQRAVTEPPPVQRLNGNIAGTDLRYRLLGRQAVVEPSPPVPPLSGNFAGTHFRQAVVEPPPPVPSLSGNIAGTRFRQAVVEPPPVLPMPFDVYPQQPHNSYRNGFTGLPEEHPSKRVNLGTGYRAVEGTGQGREEERYEDVRGKRNRYVGDYNGYETPRSGIHYNPLPDPYRQTPFHGGANSGSLVYHRHEGRLRGEEPMPVGLWQDNSRRIGLAPAPPPPPSPPATPYGRVSYENFGPQNNLQPYRRSFY